jgi:hypothetical protein
VRGKRHGRAQTSDSPLRVTSANYITAFTQQHPFAAAMTSFARPKLQPFRAHAPVWHAVGRGCWVIERTSLVITEPPTQRSTAEESWLSRLEANDVTLRALIKLSTLPTDPKVCLEFY